MSKNRRTVQKAFRMHPGSAFLFEHAYQAALLRGKLSFKHGKTTRDVVFSAVSVILGEMSAEDFDAFINAGLKRLDKMMTTETFGESVSEATMKRLRKEAVKAPRITPHTEREKKRTEGKGEKNTG